MPKEFVADNNIIMSWCFDDRTTDYTDAILNSLQNASAFVPAIWPLEVGNVLVISERKKIISKTDTIRFLAEIENLPIKIEQETPERMLKDILSLAREYTLTTYDASYLDLAIRKNLPIATLDTGLLAAALRCEVSIYLRSKFPKEIKKKLPKYLKDKF